ncbi:hypothetical protein [Phyllobacterium zundukense]|uniref:Hypervirulence associated protein TUDOR domain-containing protein n=1 Tax=Phyllobacterium zundukense TaxID=1867719 RepID=A0A2N9VU94_9HYPH|nr:hypothetical protein [Phyllobacterium zundukense]ATU92993.1 hypothetical protein BLM14_16275 [Phyllobacterium zundukense]PIO43062.1 hypothetical protein B5P45_21820 [Phyllobacterium zundukense]
MNMRRRYPIVETPVHRFAIGQKVRMKGWGGSKMKSTATFCIMATLPASGGSLQYRIRDNEEKHERIAMEDNLEAADMWSSKDRSAFEQKENS